jgi:hypothetical protein
MGAEPEARIFLDLELHGNGHDTPEPPWRVAFRLPLDVRRHSIPPQLGGDLAPMLLPNSPHVDDPRLLVTSTRELFSQSASISRFRARRR